MTTEQNLMVNEVLEKYCEWLNRWTEAEQSSHRYELSQFRVYSPEKKLWGYVSDLVVVQQYYTLLTFHTSDGNNGGPTILTAWLEQGLDGIYEVIHLVQEFDTSVQSIYDHERGFLSGP